MKTSAEDTGERAGLAMSDLRVRVSPRGPRFGQPLVVQVSRRREQLDHHHRAAAWWESLTDDHRRRVLEVYRRSNGGFGNATNAMLWYYSAKLRLAARSQCPARGTPPPAPRALAGGGREY